MSKSKTADILERELEPTIKEWLRRVNLVPELTDIPPSDADRTGHLPKLYYDLISRLRFVKDAHRPVSAAAATHGQIWRAQGYSACMVVEESRVFQVATFGTLHLHRSELDQKQVLFRRDGHRGRGGCTTYGSRAQFDGSDASPNRSLVG
jgi:hypothetical protein